MPHSYGIRARTRHMFARNFREHGMPIKLTTYLKTYKVGDIVDIKANGAIHKGMPHKFYHGRTGIIYNVTKSAVGIIINKKVGNRFLEKRVNIRVEHIKHSKCRDDFLRRVKENAAAKLQAKTDGVKVNLKRQPVKPREARFVSIKHNIPTTLNPIPYDTLFLAAKKKDKKKNMTKKHHNSSKKKAKSKAQHDVDTVEPSSPATTHEKRDQYSENEGFFTGSGGFNFPDYRNGHLVTPLPSRSSSLVSEVSLNSLADLLGPELDDDQDSVQSVQEQDQDHDSQEACKSTDQTWSVAESNEIHDDLWSWISSGLENKERAPGLQGRDWAAIGLLTLTAMAVRLWKIETPNQVVLDEAQVGKYVNGYLTKHFMFDTQPPLGKMLLAGISKIVGNYEGEFPFDDISEQRVDGESSVNDSGGTVSVLYSTLAHVMVKVYRAGLESHQPPYRKSAQGDYDLTLLSHPFRHSLLSPYVEDRNPTQAWSDVAYGSVIQLQSETRPAVFLHSFKQMWDHSTVAQLDQDQRQYQQVAGYEYSDLNTLWIVIRANMNSASASVSASKGAGSTEHPTTSNPKHEKGIREEENEIPKRLQYLKDGDLIRLRHVSTRRCLHSRNVPSMTDRRRGQAQSLSDQNECDQSCEVSAVGEAGSTNDVQYNDNNHNGDDGPQDWWTVQVIESKPLGRLFAGTQSRTGSRIKALETTFRLRHHVLGCYLQTTERELPEDVLGGAGRSELSCVRDESVKQSTVWRITMNEHDYLPMDTALAVYPKMSILEKIAELHTLMWTQPRAFEASEPLKRLDPLPDLWSLMMGTTSARTLWRKTYDDPDVAEAKEGPSAFGDNAYGREAQTKDGTIQQNSIVANPAVWWTSNLGLVIFAGLQVLFMLGGLLGYLENGSLLAIMRQQLSASAPVFAAWAIYILPLLLPLLPENRSTSRSTLDLYYPALYCAVLVTSTALSSVLSAIASRRHQFSFLLGVILLITSVSNFISPFSYGTRMTLGQCESRAHWVNTGAAFLQLPLLPQQDKISGPTIVLECGAAFPSAATPSSLTSPLQITPAVRRKRAPVLQKHYPSVEEALPMQHIFMTPSQRPPQLWHVNRQAGEPNPYQRQQMQAIFELIEKEEKQRRVQERLEMEEKERKERQERQRLELEERRREMERELKREQEAREKERLKMEESRRWEVELEVEEELRQEQKAIGNAW
ncbi:hypothetical protein EC968_005190 [Mortierella alpina]|nr:hypothetical protein EC968_005190 [Mortierella alpina]